MLGVAAAPERGADGLLHDPAASVRQIVAFNLTLGRKARGLSQDDLGALLTQLTGKPWSGSTVSAAENGWDSRVSKRRVRHFDVNEVAAFALALRVPLGWFFLAPAHTPQGQPVDDATPWITINTAHDRDPGGEPRPALNMSQFHWLVASQADPSDPDDLMVRRLRRQGLADPTPTPDGDDPAMALLLRRIEKLEQQLLPQVEEQR